MTVNPAACVTLSPFLRSRRFLGGVGVGFLTALGVRVRFFCPTTDVRLDHFVHYTLELGIPVEMVQFLLKLLLKQISCCVPRFPLILTAKFHSLYVKESASEILESWESEILKRPSDILAPTPQPCCQQHKKSRILVTTERKPT